ncbi:HDOD domain-containing protein [Pseudomonas aeruginosa]|uniref:HDOD domain-containing protein n=1 Tax=Pseudomonas aeruginosa TaxID=287 RepID=A0A6A9JSM8_PSEAI|nr:MULTISPECIES: HDOD domain-containing protein [Pseudomonas]KRV07827.1 histidine kinase [Pseudomonas aeruginosa]KRV15730.1 histidine kinase [Pseudomonas aeruginosa]KSS10749.1 histidine kinase [Pseudomonas aeruginosa]MBG5299169.1 HDOD domain-containing protein [Pseudomonas aeruginosa]MBL4546974.1 HDOD domain-containing protein [Pseudomonas aeruginosa]
MTDRLAAWLEELDRQPLPIPASHYAGLHAALSDSRRSLREIADQLQGSPTLALSILREANRAESARDNPAESLEVALSRLGLARASQLLKTLPSIQDAEMPRVLGQMLLISQHAMQQASGLFGARLARLWQEIHWGSLLTMAPVWALANARPQLLEQWQQRVLVQGEPTLRVERELLGMRLLPICLALAERWRLPQWVIQGYRLLACDRRLLVRALRIARDHQSPLLQQQQLDAQPDLARWLTQPANCTLLANGLAIAAHQSWDGPHMLRWQRLTGLYLGQPLTEVQQQVHMLAAQSARLHARPPLWHPAVALIWPWQASRWRAEAAPPPPPSAEALAEWRQHCAELLREPSPFSNVVQLTACARDALLACGLQRMLLLVADRTQVYVLAQQSAGLEPGQAKLQLEIAGSPLLKKLFQQPALLRIGPNNQDQLLPALGEPLRQLFPGPHLLLRSLGNGSRVVMLVLADLGGQPFSDLHAQAFAKTAQCTERAIQQFGRQRRTE